MEVLKHFSFICLQYKHFRRTEFVGPSALLPTNIRLEFWGAWARTCTYTHRHDTSLQDKLQLKYTRNTTKYRQTKGSIKHKNSRVTKTRVEVDAIDHRITFGG